MVIALFGVSNHHFSPLSSRGKASQNSFQLTTSTTPSPSAGSRAEPRPVSAASLLAARESVRRLRLDLIEMLRISLRAVDCATKAYALGLVEFALHAPSGQKKLEHLNQTIIATTQELYEKGELDDTQLGFNESARAISAALLSMCQQAYEISSHTVTLLRGGIHHSTKELVQLGEHVDCSLRLCVAAFIKQRVEYAEVVLSSMRNPRRQEYTAPVVRASDVHEWSIAVSLKQMMENLCIVAMASTITIPLSA
jgi:hypothetical protein